MSNKKQLVHVICPNCKRFAEKDIEANVHFCPVCMAKVTDAELYIRMFHPRAKLS